MLKLFDIIKQGIITLITSPFWLAYFLIRMVICLFIYLITLFKAIIIFFQGKPVFTTREDKAIQLMIQEEEEKMAQRREEALKNADSL